MRFGRDPSVVFVVVLLFTLLPACGESEESPSFEDYESSSEGHYLDAVNRVQPYEYRATSECLEALQGGFLDLGCVCGAPSGTVAESTQHYSAPSMPPAIRRIWNILPQAVSLHDFDIVCLVDKNNIVFVTALVADVLSCGRYRCSTGYTHYSTTSTTISPPPVTDEVCEWPWPVAAIPKLVADYNISMPSSVQAAYDSLPERVYVSDIYSPVDCKVRKYDWAFRKAMETHRIYCYSGGPCHRVPITPP